MKLLHSLAKMRTKFWIPKAKNQSIYFNGGRPLLYLRICNRFRIQKLSLNMVGVEALNYSLKLRGHLVRMSSDFSTFEFNYSPIQSFVIKQHRIFSKSTTWGTKGCFLLKWDLSLCGNSILKTDTKFSPSWIGEARHLRVLILAKRLHAR